MRNLRNSIIQGPLSPAGLATIWHSIYDFSLSIGSDGGTVDTGDLKSPGSNPVRVRIPLRASLILNELSLNLAGRQYLTFGPWSNSGPSLAQK
jgi:hypothetical protein